MQRVSRDMTVSVTSQAGPGSWKGRWFQAMLLLTAPGLGLRDPPSSESELRWD